jgi:hypothetical protein
MDEDRHAAEPSRVDRNKLGASSRPVADAHLTYEPPRLVLIGSLEELTEGGTQEGTDATGLASRT